MHLPFITSQGALRQNEDPFIRPVAQQWNLIVPYLLGFATVWPLTKMD